MVSRDTRNRRTNSKIFKKFGCEGKRVSYLGECGGCLTEEAWASSVQVSPAGKASASRA